MASSIDAFLHVKQPLWENQPKSKERGVGTSYKEFLVDNDGYSSQRLDALCIASDIKTDDKECRVFIIILAILIIVIVIIVTWKMNTTVVIVIMAMTLVITLKVLMILIFWIKARLMMTTTAEMILTMKMTVASPALVHCASAR